MAAPRSSRGVWWALVLLALLAGTVWRVTHLSNRPLHADEAVQAWQTWNLLRGEGYRYDPLDRHGPSLYYGAAVWQRARGGDAATFNDESARRFVLIAGIATLALLAFAPSALGESRWLGLFAVTLGAFETLSTLYHTYFVQEAWLAILVWAFFFLLQKPGTSTRWIMLGLIAGLAQTTKEIAPFYLFLAWIAVRVNRPKLSTPTRAWVLALVGFLPPFLLLYSSFGAHPGGVVDAFKTYVLQAQRVSEPAHHYPWWSYLRTLGILPTGGPHWGQYPLLVLAMIGGALSLRRSATTLHRSAAVLTFGLLIGHSLIAYKTPWLLLTPMIGLVLLAAFALQSLANQRSTLAIVATAIALATSAHSRHVSQLALDRYPGDVRNPYFYEQTPRAFMRLVDRIQQLQGNLDRPMSIAVVSAEHAWPLPWYLRDHDNVGYFDAAPESLTQFDLIIWDPQVGELPATAATQRTIEYVGLRPNVLLVVAIVPAVWEASFPPLP